MKFSLGTDPLDLFDGFLGLGGIGWPPLGPVVIPGVPALTSEAIEASTAQSGPASPVVETSGGITFNLLFDAAAMAAPASFRAGIEQAAALLGSVISDKITVNIKIDYSGTGGGAAAGADSGQYISYSALRTDLINAATPGDTTFNTLPSGSSFQGQTYVAVWNAQLKALGLLSANDTTTDDGSATFATDINPNLLVGVALHELTHALGRIPYGQPYGTEPDIFDMFRFTSVGTRLIDGTSTAPAAYFSLDGGVTKLGDYGQTSDSSDFLNSGVQGSTDPFDEFYSGNTVQHLTALDITQLDALGFHASSPDTQTPTLASATLKMLAGTTQTITSSLLSATDNVSSGAQLHYTVTRAPADGTLLLNGVATTSFTQADLNNGLVSYHETASGVKSDNFLFTVTDAAGNVTGTQTFQIGIDHPPVLTLASTNVSANAGQSLPASSLFSASDADGDALSYYLYEGSAANTGHFVVNGTAEPVQTSFLVTAAQLAQTTFVAGSAGTSADLYVIAYDGQSYSGNGIASEFHVNVAGVDHPPVLTVPSANVSASAGQTISASSLFSASDADGDALSYYLYEGSAANTGHFVVNGTAEPVQTSFLVTAAQLAQTTFVAGSAGTSADLYAIAYDGHAYSGNGIASEFHVNVAGAATNHAPVLTVPSANVSASAGQSLPVSSLFSATDADGDALSYYLYEGSAANTGHFVVNGTAEPAQTSFLVTAAQLAQTTFVAGSAGTSADLYAIAYDGHAYSGNGIASEFHVNVAAAGQAPAATSPLASAGAGQFFQSSLLAGDAFGHFSVHDIASALHDFHVLV
jgi:hypothetical protein